MSNCCFGLKARVRHTDVKTCVSFHLVGLQWWSWFSGSVQVWRLAAGYWDPWQTAWPVCPPGGHLSHPAPADEQAQFSGFHPDRKSGLLPRSNSPKTQRMKRFGTQPWSRYDINLYQLLKTPIFFFWRSDIKLNVGQGPSYPWLWGPVCGRRPVCVHLPWSVWWLGCWPHHPVCCRCRLAEGKRRHCWLGKRIPRIH